MNRPIAKDVGSWDKVARISLSPKLELETLSIRREMAIARDVQKASFPQQPPAIPGLSCATYYKPALSVGGDYYDFLPLQGGLWSIAIGDVSGKGLGAALVLANLQGSLRAQLLHSSSDPATRIANVNRLVFESSPVHFFASLFYAEYRPLSRILRYVNAGHHAPIVVRRSYGGCRLLPLAPECAPVGVLEDSRYTSTTFQLEVGDVLLAFTDGVTESESSDGRAFGHERLEKVLGDYRSEEPQEILQQILDELSAHSAGCSQADDITIMVMRVEAQERDKRGVVCR